MSKEFSFPNSGTCSKQTNFVLNDDHTIASMEVIGGCNGNLKGICRLVKGMKAEDVIDRMEGTLCGFRNTSCPDQIAKNLKKALEEMNIWIATLLRRTSNAPWITPSSGHRTRT